MKGRIFRAVVLGALWLLPGHLNAEQAGDVKGKVFRSYGGCVEVGADLAPLITDEHDLQDEGPEQWEISEWENRPSQARCTWLRSVERPDLGAPPSWKDHEYAPDAFHEKVSARIMVTADNQTKEKTRLEEERLIAENPQTYELRPIESVHHPLLDAPENWNLMLFREAGSDDQDWAYLLWAVSTDLPHMGMTTRVVIRSTSWASTSSNSSRETMYRDHLRPMPDTEAIAALFLNLLERCVAPETARPPWLFQGTGCR